MTKKIVIKLRQDNLVVKKYKEKTNNKNINICPICFQKIDLCVTSHKNKPFIDNKLYPKICFTCFHVPKIFEQKYDERGYIKEEICLDYSHENLHKPEDLVYSGSADSLEHAKRCVKAVKNLHIEKCSKKDDKKTKPKLEFYSMD